MYPPVATNDPAAVQVEVQKAYLSMFPEASPLFVPEAFGWITECFAGRYQDYAAIDAHYHDLEHTLQGTLCLARLLYGRHLAGAEPRLTESAFRLGLLGILFHDTGYLRKRSDVEGTGAKYTVTHVERSTAFAEQLLLEKGCSKQDIETVQNMICCTGLTESVTSIQFRSEIEKVTGFAVATADLLGQMAAEDYVDKLPILYNEFAEAARFSGDKSHFVASYLSAEDLIARTPSFWRDSIRPKLDGEFLGLCRFLNQPYPSGPNFYLQRIEANIALVERRLRDEQSVA